MKENSWSRYLEKIIIKNKLNYIDKNIVFLYNKNTDKIVVKNKKQMKEEIKMYKNNKGITLIALVITIIVMLILVGVTISMAVNGGLFDYAGKAVGYTNNALKEEQQIANGGIIVGENWYDSIDDYLDEIRSENQNGGTTSTTEISFTIDGTEYQAEDGWTWEEWCDSSYNTDGYYYHDAGASGVFGATDGYKVFTSSNTGVYSTDSIISGHAYIYEPISSNPDVGGAD